MPARWEETYDTQLDMFKLWRSDKGIRLLSGYAQSVMASSPESQLAKSVYHDFPDKLASALFLSDPVYIEPDMMTLLEVAYPNFEPEPLQPTDLICESGFALLPRPMYITDVHGKSVSYRAINWHPVTFATGDENESTTTGHGLYLTLYSKMGDEDDYLREAYAAGKELFPIDWMPLHVTPWPFGMGYDGQNAGLRTVAQQVQCLWRLMAQTIATRTESRPGKEFRRRWERADWKEKAVTVIRLRRPRAEQDADHEPGSVEWSHRWLVGGHWRNQWYASVGLHRQIWISPFIKGPADKELVVRKLHVYEFVR